MKFKIYINNKLDAWAVKRVEQRQIPLTEKMAVVFESTFPPEFVITKHAEDRLEERFNCDKGKFMKLTVKAWDSKETVSESYLDKKKDQGYKYCKYRKFQGFIWVFVQKFNSQLGISQKLLVTVYNPKVRNI